MKIGGLSALAATWFAAIGAFGAEVTGDVAESTADAFLQRSAMARRMLPDRTVSGSLRWRSLWIVNLSPSGHVVVSGSDRCAPIVQFTTDDFTEPEPDTARMDMMSGASERCDEAEADATLGANSEWATYASSASTASRRTKAGAAGADTCSPFRYPLLDASWHQGSPYGDLSPLTVVCGCMATAGGQELRYWRWPYHLPKFRTWGHGVSNEPTQDIRVNGFVPFDYDLIYGSYPGGGTPEKTGLDSHGNNAKRARLECAHLTQWAQSLVHMHFAPGASGGTQKLCQEANEFCYERGSVISKWSEGYDGLWSAITNDLEFGSPIQVNTPGHQMVVDGYGVEIDEDGVQKDWININYGWGGGITWVDLRTECESRNLAHFQVGFRPRKMVQVEPIAKKATGAIDLTFHLPFCYTNAVSGFTVQVYTVNDEDQDSFVREETLACAQPNTSTVFTKGIDLSGYADGTKLRFYVAPVMADGSDTVADVVETTVGTPAAPPQILGMSVRSNGIELLQDGFFAECGIGVTNEIKVTCSESTTELMGYTSRPTMLPDDKVGVAKSGNTFTFSIDATEILSDWDGDMMRFTLIAKNADGTEAYDNMVLRFSNVRKVVNGEYEVVESGVTTEPLEFCGTDCTLDAKGKTLTFAAGMLSGSGSVTLEDSVGGGGFVFETLNGFSGLLSFTDGVSVTLPADASGYSDFHGTLRTVSGAVPILGNLPATATLDIAAGAANILAGVEALAKVTGEGTVCVTNGTNRLGNSRGLDGEIVVSGDGTVLVMDAGCEGYVTVGDGSTLLLALTDEQYNFGYYTFRVVSDGGTVLFTYNGEPCATVADGRYYIFEATANTWSSTGENDTYSDIGHWSKGRLPVENEYAIFMVSSDEEPLSASILLDMESDVTLKGLKVTGALLYYNTLTIADGGTHKLNVGKFTSDSVVDLDTTQIVAETVEPNYDVLLHAGKPVAYKIDGSYGDRFRLFDDPDNVCGLTVPEAWRGTVEFVGWDSDVGSDALNPNDYGNAESVVRFKGVVGRLYYSDAEGGATYLPTVELVDLGATPALLWHNGSGSVAETFERLTGDGTFRTRSPANGGWEKVLIKDVSGFTGDFDLESKTVALGGALVPSTDTSNNGRLHICGDITNQTGSVWRANDNVFIAGGAKLAVKGVIDTQTIVSFGSAATLELLDGGEIKVLSGSASSEPVTFAQRFRAGKLTLKDDIEEELSIDFCADAGKWTTVDVAGHTLTLGPDAMTGSGDIYFTSSDTENRGRVVIQGLDGYSGTIRVDGTVDIEFPEDASSSSCTVLVMGGLEFSVKAGNECNIRVESGALLKVVLSADQILYGYDASDTVTVEDGGGVMFFNRKGEQVESASATATVYEPLPGATTGLSATAVWMTGDFESVVNEFDIGLNGNSIANRNIVIDGGAKKGVTIDLPYGELTKASVIVRFRIPSGGAPSDNAALAGVLSTDEYPISAICRTEGGAEMEGAFLDHTQGWALNTGSWNFTADDEDPPAAEAGHGYMLFAYQSDTYGGASHGTALYLGDSMESLYGGNKSSLQWGGKTLTTISIGGPVDEKERTFVWDGLEIDGIALFTNQWLTAETAQDFAFPHMELNVYDGETLSVDAGNPRIYDGIGGLSASGVIRIDNIAELDEGTYVIAKWRTAADANAYGRVGSLLLDGIDEDYGAELVYGEKDISLRVFKAVYSATISGDANFSPTLFTPELPSDYSRKTLEVVVTADATLTLPAGGVAVKAIDFRVADGATLTLSGGAISADVIGIYGRNPIGGTLDLGEGTVVRLPTDVESPFQLATTVTGTMTSLILGDSVFNGEWSLVGNTLTIRRFKAISINFGADQGNGNASVGRRAWEGIASVANWLDTMSYGVSGTYPTMGQSALALSDSDGTTYPSMKLYINSRGGNYYGKGDTETTTSALLYGFIDDLDNSTVNAGIKVTGVNDFAAKYSVYVYFNADAAVGTERKFPPYYINGIMYMGDGTTTVPGRETWGTVLSDSLADGVNALVVHGLTDDTLVVAQPNNMGNGIRGCIAAIQIVVDNEHEFEPPDCLESVSVVAPSDDWSSRTLPTYAFPTNVAGSIVSFGSTVPTDYYQMLGDRESIVALITGTDSAVYEAAGLQSEEDVVSKSCGNRDLYLIIEGGVISNAIGIINQNYGGSVANGSQSGGNAMVQLCGDAVVQYAYGAGREGNGGNAPGSTGVTIKDGAILTGSAFGGWSSQHQANPTVQGNTSVKVLNVQSVNDAESVFAITSGSIVGGSVYAANSSSRSTINGSSSVVVDLMSLSIPEETNFVKRLIGGCAGFGRDVSRSDYFGGVFAVNGDSSVTVSAPDTVVFTGDITGGGFIAASNTGMSATVGGDSSVTLNGGTYRGVTITAGACGPVADKATVAGDATLTINGGVFEDVTLAGGNASGAKTLAINADIDLADSTVTGFDRCVVGDGCVVVMTAGQEGAISVPTGSTLRLVVGPYIASVGYEPAGLTGEGSVEYWENVGGVLTKIASDARVSGNVLLPKPYANPVTGEAVTFGNFFTGAESADWATSANWDPARTPYIANSGGGFDPAAFDGDNVSDAATRSAIACSQIEGWNVRWGLFNGAEATVANLNKLQGDTNFWIMVDASSKLTVNGWGAGNIGPSGGTLDMDLYVASEDGVCFNADLLSGSNDGSLTVNYHLAGEGSVSFKALEICNHAIRRADVRLSGGEKSLRSKTLVSFSSTTKAFAADAAIKVLAPAGNVFTTAALTSVNATGETSLTTANAVGECELVQTGTGIVLWYVDGEPSDGVLAVHDDTELSDGTKWSCGELPADGSDVVLDVSGDVTLTIDAARTFGSVEIIGSGTLTLDGDFGVAAASVTVGAGVNVVCSNASSLRGAFSGSGTMTYDGCLPPTTATDSVFTNAAWRGTVCVKGISSSTPKTALYVNYWGNVQSRLKFNGVAGYLPGRDNNGAWQMGYDGSALGELVLEDDGDTPAFQKGDGYSAKSWYSYCAFAKLSGAGTLSEVSGKTQTPYFIFEDASEFAGSIDVSEAMCVMIGSSASDYDLAQDKKIIIDSGKEASIADGKTWTAPNGVNVGGVLRFAGTGSVAGPLSAASGATLDFTGSESAQPVTGTLSVANGTTIVLPGDAVFPYTLADEIVIGDPCSVTVRIGDDVFADTALKVADGAILRNRSTVFEGGDDAVAWDDLVWDIGYHGGATEYDITVHATGSGTIDLGSLASLARIFFVVDEGVELTLAGTLAAGEIWINGSGAVVCGAADTLAGTLKGNGTVSYGVNPAVGADGLVITDAEWVGDLLIGGERYRRAISINLGSSYGTIGSSEWAGLVPVVNWLNTSASGDATNYPTGYVSLDIGDSLGASYPDMRLYLCSRGGNYRGKGDASASPTAAMLHGFLDNNNSGTQNNSGVRLTGVNAFAAKYAVYVYFSKDADAGSTSAFPFYYINGIAYCGDGSATVPGNGTWGTVRTDALENGVNALVVRGLTDDTIVVAQPNNVSGRGCIAAIQVVEDPDGEPLLSLDEVGIVAPSDDWASLTLPTHAYATNVVGSYISFGDSAAYQLIGSRPSIVANITGTDESVYEAAGLQSELDTSTRSCGDSDIYLLVSGGTVENAIGIINQNYGGSVANGSQSGGNAMVQLCGDAVVQYAYGAGREGNGGNAPGSTGVTIKDGAILTGSAFGGWSSQHQANPTVQGNTSVKVLNVQSVNDANAVFAITSGSIVGGSVYAANSSSRSTINGSSSVVVDLMSLSIPEETNFVKRLIGGCAGFGRDVSRSDYFGGVFAVNGDSSVTVSAPDTVVFTGDITGGGFIAASNTGMSATVGGDSSVTLNGGTYRGVTITAGACGPVADKATVAGDATLTINGGVFEDVTLSGGNATGAKTLAINADLDLTDATIDGFDTCVIGEGSVVVMRAGREGSVAVSAGATFRLVATPEQAEAGYEPAGITGEGAVEYWVHVDGVLTRVPASRVDGINLLGGEITWGPATESGLAADVGYMDGTVAVITNFAATVTVPASATGVRMVHEGGDVTGAFLAPALGEPCMLELDPDGSVGGVPVRPEIDESAPVPFGTDGAESVVIAVKVIGGLWYGVSHGGELSGGGVGGEGAGVTDPVQAPATGTLLMSAPKGEERRFYRIRVSPSPSP